MDTTSSILAVLWAGGLAATPVALIVGALCRWKGLRPATRHVLWLAVLVSFVTPAVGMWAWRPEWSKSERLIAAAGSVIDRLEPRTGRCDEPAGVVVRQAPSRAVEKPAESAERRPGQQHPAIPDPVARRGWSAEFVDQRVSPASGHGVAPGIAAAPAALVRTPRSAARADRAPDAAGTMASDPLAPVAMLPKAANSTPQGAPTSTPVDDKSSTVARQPVPVSSEVVGTALGAAPLSSWSSARAWVTGVVALRDAIAELPPVPVAVWLSGALLLFAVRALTTLRALRVLRRSRPACAEIRSMVRAVAKDLGLSRVPEVVVVDSSVSPMIWCGMVPRLVLPAALWRALDEDSRRAIVVHELAHLKRKDHVLCWVESLIGAAYWWHPVAWWARRRLRDESEACCDAWVTSLLPGSRRAYAAALVATKSYLSEVEKGRGPSGEGPWLGVMSGSAKKLARRITMVMTQRTTPNVSLVGACVAVLVVAVGTFVTPTIACPPEEGQKSEAAARRSDPFKMKGKVKSTAPRAGQPAEPAPTVTFFGEAPAFEAMRGGQGASSTPAPVAASPSTRTTSPRVQTWQSFPGGVLVAPVAPKAPKAPRPARAPRADAQPAQLAPLSGVAGVPVDLEALKVGRTARLYHIEEGKREALWGLMSRDDVPVLVQLQGDGILIYATEEQHPVLEAFVKMINPTSGRSGALNPLSSRSVGEPGVGAARGSRIATGVRSDALAALTTDRAALLERAGAMRAEGQRMKEHSAALAGQAARYRERAAQAAGADAQAAAERAAYERAVAGFGQTDAAQRAQMEEVLREQIEQLERRVEELTEHLSGLEDLDDEQDDADDEDVSDADADTDEEVGMIDAPEAFEVVGFELGDDMDEDGASEHGHGHGHGHGEHVPCDDAPCADAPCDEAPVESALN